MNPLTTSVIIPTYNRPLALRRCLASILRQSRLPDELLIIDDGELAEHPLRQEFEDRGVIFFLDDDVELFPDYIELIEKIYSGYHGMRPLGGVGGLAVERNPAFWTNLCQWLFQVVFLISPLRPGRVSLSGFSDQIGLKVLPLHQPFSSDIIGGSLCSYHRRVFNDNYFFAENIAGYGQGEDKDFSYRVSRHYLLLTEPRAHQYHDQSPVMRHDQYRLGQEYVLATHRFFQRHIETSFLSRVLFWYTVTGYLLKWILLSLVGHNPARNRERLGGIWEGLRILLREGKGRSQKHLVQRQKALKVSVIVPTYNRPSDLSRCIASVIQQTTRPDELIVIDDGALDAQFLRGECEQAGIGYIYFRKKPEERGLTKSRNLGIAMSSGEIIVFLDDDVELLPDFMEQILIVYETDRNPESLGGVSGMEIPRRPVGLLDVLIWLFQIVFLLSPVRPGHVTRAGFSDQIGTRILSSRRTYPSEIIGGGLCSYRRKVFDHFVFAEEIDGYGQGEDKDFSWRVSRRYRLITNPLARVHHYQAPAMRHTRERQGEEYLLATHRFFRRYFSQGMLSRGLFLYAITGHLIKWSLLALLGGKTSGRRERLRGIARGYCRIIREERDA